LQDALRVIFVDIDDIFYFEEHLKQTNKTLESYIDISNQHALSETQKMQAIRAQWNQALSFAAKSQPGTVET
jgi:uncharacterized protein with NRDE domain